MVWPILISVSVTPGAFSARAGQALVAKAAAAAALDCRNMRRVFMRFLLFDAIVGSGGPRAAGFRFFTMSRNFVRSRGDEVAEQLPTRALDRRELHLTDRIEIVGRGVDLHTGQQHRQFEVLDVSCLFHDVLAREIVPTL